MNRTELQNLYDSIVTDLGVWAERFGITAGGQVAGLGVPDEPGKVPGFRDRDMAYNRDGDLITVSRLLPDGRNSTVYLFDVGADGADLRYVFVLLNEQQSSMSPLPMS